MRIPSLLTSPRRRTRRGNEPPREGPLRPGIARALLIAAARTHAQRRAALTPAERIKSDTDDGDLGALLTTLAGTYGTLGAADSKMCVLVQAISSL